MGAILLRWRNSPTTIEKLEKLDKEISSLEATKRSTIESQRRILGTLIIYSTCLYLLFAIVVYFYYWPNRWRDRLYYALPLLAFPLIIWIIRKFLHWYFVKRISKNEHALEHLKDERSSILEEVMEKETYKKAKEILEKFDPEKYKKMEDPEKIPPAMKSPEGQDLRQRRGAPTSQTGPMLPPLNSQRPLMETPNIAAKQLGQGMVSTPGTIGAGRGMPTPQTTGARPNPAHMPAASRNGANLLRQTPLPQPILPRERTVTDRVLDFLVGDGPANRYALICKHCSSHNGMALKEEFNFISFRCCYCYVLNESREKRPTAPRIESSPVARRLQLENPTDTDTGTHDSKTSDVENTNVECETTSDRSVDHVNSTDDNSQSD